MAARVSSVLLLLFFFSAPAKARWWKVQTSGVETNLRAVSAVYAHDQKGPFWTSEPVGPLVRTARSPASSAISSPPSVLAMAAPSNCFSHAPGLPQPSNFLAPRFKWSYSSCFSDISNNLFAEVIHGGSPCRI